MGRPPITPTKERRDMFELWLKGYNYVEIAQKFDVYRQKARFTVLSFKPSLEDFKKHDTNRRIREAARQLNA